MKNEVLIDSHIKTKRTKRSVNRGRVKKESQSVKKKNTLGSRRTTTTTTTSNYDTDTS